MKDALGVLIILACIATIIIDTILIIRNEIKHKQKIVACNHCKYLYFNNDGSTGCNKNISKDMLASFNVANIRPCKELEDNNGKEKET